MINLDPVMEDLTFFWKRRGGSYGKNLDHHTWSQTVQLKPEVISVTFIPISSLLGGIDANGFLTHAINLYIHSPSSPAAASGSSSRYIKSKCLREPTARRELFSIPETTNVIEMKQEKKITDDDNENTVGIEESELITMPETTNVGQMKKQKMMDDDESRTLEALNNLNETAGVGEIKRKKKVDNNNRRTFQDIDECVDD